MVDNIEYCHLSIDSDRRVWFILVKLQKFNDATTMFFIFSQYNSEGSIELDTFLMRYVHFIQKSLNRYMTYEEIRMCIDKSENEISLDHQ